MAQVVTPAVLLPRFTSIVGIGAFPSLPIEVTAFQRANLTVWRGPMIGTSTAISIAFLESTDRNTWFEIKPAISPLENVETPVQLSFDRRWFRVVVHLVGTNPGVTCWVQGFFVNREE
ncbi:MAG: hypothetical protein P8170_02480 [Gemmatimonadota bacterium]